MGSWYGSFSFRGDRRAEIRERLEGWLRAKGFERLPEGSTFPAGPDERGERGAFLLRSAGWTTLVYSEKGEESRLALELTRLPFPCFRFRVAEGDVWAYEVSREGETLAAFASRHDLDDAGPAGPGDLEALCAAFELPRERSLLERLRKAQRKRAIFADGPAFEFLQALGLEAAAISYDSLAAGELLREGVVLEALAFRRPAFDPMAGIDLHALEPEVRAREGAEEPAANQDPPEEWHPMAKLVGAPRAAGHRPTLRVARGTLRTLVGAAFHLLPRRLFVRAFGGGEPTDGGIGPVDAAARLRGLRLEGDFLVHDKLGFRLRVPPGATLARDFFLALEWHGIALSTEALEASRVRRSFELPVGTRILRSRNLWAGRLPVKEIRCEREKAGKVLRWSSLLVAAPNAVFRITARPARDAPLPSDETLDRIAECVQSFELLRR